MAIHDRIRDAREQAGLSQTELASLLGVTRSACSQWESSGGTAPRRERLAQLASVLDVNFEWLATGTGRSVGADGANQPATPLTPDQVEMLTIYRRLPPRIRAAVLTFLRSLMA